MRKLLSAGLLLPLLLSACGDPDPAPPASTPAATLAGTDSLRSRIADLLKSKQATVGIAVLNLASGDTFSYNGERRFPLMSVAKFPQALLLLRMADSGRIATTDTVRYSEKDLAVSTGSSFRKDHPGKTVSLSLLESMRYSIGQSDNISSVKFFGMEGGPAAVESFVHRLGVVDLSIQVDYTKLRPETPLQNSATPRALAQLLSLFAKGSILSDSNRRLLYQLMAESSSGANRIKAGLPAGTVFAHKTGTSGTDPQTGVTLAFNDVGLVELPGGGRLAIAVFIADSKEDEAENAAIMQEVGRLVWKYWGEGRR